MLGLLSSEFFLYYYSTALSMLSVFTALLGVTISACGSIASCKIDWLKLSGSNALMR
ncbi:MAG: hypothetical protein QG632_276 [Candidatus Dependentiae bacterium]|nr:hypothetical protein [Candidatus Dependentiae bacterium]